MIYFFFLLPARLLPWALRCQRRAARPPIDSSSRQAGEQQGALFRGFSRVTCVQAHAGWLACRGQRATNTPACLASSARILVWISTALRAPLILWRWPFGRSVAGAYFLGIAPLATYLWKSHLARLASTIKSDERSFDDHGVGELLPSAENFRAVDESLCQLPLQPCALMTGQKRGLACSASISLLFSLEFLLYV